MNTPAAKTAFQNGYALLIGVDENQIANYALPAVSKDVNALAKVLLHPERCGYLEENIKILRGRDASKSGIEQGLDWLSDKMAQDDSNNETAVIYFSGHGHVSDNNHYLIPYDMTTAFKKSALRASKFAEKISQIQPARLLVVLDCCHAGAASVKGVLDGKSMELKSTAIDLSNADFGGLSDGQGRATLSSSKGNQLSLIRKDGEMSIFTFFLIEALYGYAQSPGASPVVRVSDLIGHVDDRVPKLAKKESQEIQKPTFFMEGENFALALLMGGKGIASAAARIDPLTDAAVETMNININAGGSVNYVQGNISGSNIAGGDIIIGIPPDQVANLFSEWISKMPGGKAPKELKRLIQEIDRINALVEELKDLHHFYNKAITSFDPIKVRIQLIGITKDFKERELIDFQWNNFKKHARPMLKKAAKIMSNPDLSWVKRMGGSEIADWMQQFDSYFERINALFSELDDKNAKGFWGQLTELADGFDGFLMATMTEVDDELKDAIKNQVKLTRDAIGGLG